MRKTKEVFPPHESLQIGILLALVGGFLDAYTYLTQGGVFANAQTGNMVLCGISAAQGKWDRVGFYLIPIGAFAVGVLVTQWVQKFAGKLNLEQWRHLVLVGETLLLLVIGCLPAGIPHAVVNVTVSFVCSMQVQAFRKLAGTPYATTMCTGNLRSATEHIFVFLTSHEPSAGKKAVRYLVIILSFCVGAAAGSLFSQLWGQRSVWICCILLIGTQISLFWWEKVAPTEKVH
ncbi:MAG: YoaK family protein [Massiliimalia sp.]